eukprot:Nitzschia sp. Nitz4//scaffold318_size20451//12480//12846//NITZ4_008649-RA/size20451-snap-gene-0.0-mRNA-1//1//CDS//3329547561//4175//frame0
MGENEWLHLLSGDGSVEGGVAELTDTCNHVGDIANVGLCGPEVSDDGNAPPTGSSEPQLLQHSPLFCCILVEPLVILEQVTAFVRFGVKSVFDSTVTKKKQLCGMNIASSTH